MSNALARLRHVLGDPLFVRSGRGLVATPRARELAAPVRRALGELSTALAPGEAFDPGTSTHTFTIALPDIAELVLMPALMKRLQREAPGVRVRVVQTDARDPDLVLGMADDSRHSSKLYALRFVCLVRNDHPRVGKRLSLARFLELEHVLVAPGGTPRGVIDDMLRARGLERRVALTLAHFFSAAMVVSASDLVMSATSVLADVAARFLPVRVVPHPLGAPAVAIGMKWDPSRAADPALAWLRATLTEVARREVPPKRAEDRDELAAVARKGPTRGGRAAAQPAPRSSSRCPGSSASGTTSMAPSRRRSAPR